MASDVFHFKQFDIMQDQCAMKVGTDGVLLGAYPLHILEQRNTPASAPYRVLDIGTGTGLIAIMIAQQLWTNGLYDFCIDAVEIESAAAQQAQRNAEASPWSNHIRIHACSLEEFGQMATFHPFDLIVSNPPFYNATLKPEDEGRALARHKDALPLSQITHFAQRWLRPSGELAMIYPISYDSEVMTESTIAGLTAINLCNIITKVGKPCKRKIAEFVLNNPTTIEKSRGATGCKYTTLALRDETGNYSEEYKKMTDPYYISLR